MDSIIRTIVDMDKRARARNREAEEYLEKIDTKISDETEKMQQEHKTRAEKIIAQNEHENEQKLERALADIDRRSAEVSGKLDSIYAEKCGEWTDALVQRALEQQ